MFNKKNYLLNCEVCDTRKIKEEDYNGYEKMLINAGIVVVSDSSKSVLNRLPVTINQDCTIEVAEDIDMEFKTINGSYEITGTTAVREHTMLIVNGSLSIYPGTEDVLEKYEKIHVNGDVRCPKSLEGYLSRLSANGSVKIYPDDCVILDNTFIIDKYFPMRAKEGKKYYVEDKVIVQDKTVDLEKLVKKNVQFITGQLIVPEEMAESCVELFDETVEFVIIPERMALHYGDAVLNEHLPEKIGNRIYVYGKLEIPEDCDMEALTKLIEKIIVKGNIVLKKDQAANLEKLNAEYEQLEFKWEGRVIANKSSVRVDKVLLESSPNKVLVKNSATLKIAPDVTTELILDRLVIKNCAKVVCSEEQESAVAAIAQNVAQIGETEDDESLGMFSEMKKGVGDLLSTKMINADNYIM